MSFLKNFNFTYNTEKKRLSENLGVSENSMNIFNEKSILQKLLIIVLVVLYVTAIIILMNKILFDLSVLEIVFPQNSLLRKFKFFDKAVEYGFGFTTLPSLILLLLLFLGLFSGVFIKQRPKKVLIQFFTLPLVLSTNLLYFRSSVNESDENIFNWRSVFSLRKHVPLEEKQKLYTETFNHLLETNKNIELEYCKRKNVFLDSAINNYSDPSDTLLKQSDSLGVQELAVLKYNTIITQCKTYLENIKIQKKLESSLIDLYSKTENNAANIISLKNCFYAVLTVTVIVVVVLVIKNKWSDAYTKSVAEASQKVSDNMREDLIKTKETITSSVNSLDKLVDVVEKINPRIDETQEFFLKRLDSMDNRFVLLVEDYKKKLNTLQEEIAELKQQAIEDRSTVKIIAQALRDLRDVVRTFTGM